MKRYNGIYNKIYDIENLKEAHKNARKDKLYYKDVKKVDKNLEFYLNNISDMLKTKAYTVSEYKNSIINDKGKDRLIQKLPYYPDRIIQWAIMLQIEPIFQNTFVDFSCASQKNKGIHKASKILDNYLEYDKIGTAYCLKIDVKKFYPNINHVILKNLLRKKFKDEDLLWLLDLYIDSIEGNKGIPIGSYLSQYLANFYLTYFDHWLKENKKCKYVVRYMDDIVILHKSKEHLHKLRVEISNYLNANLDLNLKENWQVFPTYIRGIDFVGYRHFGDYKLLRKTTAKKLKSKMNYYKFKMNRNKELTYSEWCSINSYKGLIKMANCYNLKEKYINPIEDYADEYYFNYIKKKHKLNKNRKYNIETFLENIELFNEYNNISEVNK